MVDISALGIVHIAKQGNMAPLLERLRNCDLSREEKQFIEERLTNPKRAKIKPGVRADKEVDARNQEILIADAWLNYRFMMPAQSNRWLEISNATRRSESAVGLSEGAVRKILTETRPSILTIVCIQRIKEDALEFGQADEDAYDKPLILRVAPIPDL
jgi:hypothetical protein